jgi:hypothetical protein
MASLPSTITAQDFPPLDNTAPQEQDTANIDKQHNVIVHKRFLTGKQCPPLHTVEGIWDGFQTKQARCNIPGTCAGCHPSVPPLRKNHSPLSLIPSTIQFRLKHFDIFDQFTTL